MSFRKLIIETRLLALVISAGILTLMISFGAGCSSQGTLGDDHWLDNKEDITPKPIVVQPTEQSPGETVNPTATPGTAQAKYILPLSKYKDYIIPDSNSRLLTKQDISEVLYMYLITFGKNEIYARHGYVFQDDIIQSYFEDMPWYQKNPDYDESMLNDIEKQNVQLIQEYIDTAGKNYYPIESGSKIDLNGDGELDEIYLEYTPPQYNNGVWTFYNDFRLIINDASIEWYAENPDGTMYICNIDASDPYKAIAVTDTGPSDDYCAHFFYYDGIEIHSMGVIEGSEQTIAADGSGILTTSKRGSILHTWFYPQQYRLTSDRKLEEVPAELYPMKYLVKVVKELPLVKSPDDPSLSVTLNPGEDALIYASDDKEWLLIVNKDGLEGWVAIDNYNEIRGTGLTADEYFEGLIYAD